MADGTNPYHPRAQAPGDPISGLFDRNAKWSAGKTDTDPNFFHRLAAQQHPRYFWIGCSDSRVPATEIVDLDPGEMFVHRNVANLVDPHDPNFMSALQFAVEALEVEHIIVVGHYGCGGVQAAMDGNSTGAIAQWIKPLRALYKKLSSTSEVQPYPADELCRQNVAAQVVALSKNPIVCAAREKGSNLELHGWVYSLEDGLLESVIDEPDAA